MSKNIDNWFAEWFDSDHYHLLYDHRDHFEAERFIQRLFNHLQLQKGSKVLDLACGKGRHAVQVHNLDYDVLGLDLSEESINYAKRFEEKGLKFLQGDMRQLDLAERFDLTLNLFTSFGYFLSDREDKAVIKGLSEHLLDEGRIVLDYLNVKKVAELLPQEESIEKDPITFFIHKKLEKGFIIKDIRFEEAGKEHHYREFVKYIDLPTFRSYFTAFGLEIVETFGDYELNPFHEERSDRLIMIAKFKK